MYRLKYPTEQSDPPLSPRDTLPTMYDLPSENHEENGVDQFHSFQSELLWLTFFPANYRSDRIFSACDLNLYYDVHHQNWYKRPDWFGVVGVPKLYDDEDLRLSYVIWQEGVSPHVVVELLSPSTEKEDLGEEFRSPTSFVKLQVAFDSEKEVGDLGCPSQNGQAEKPPSKWEVYEKILRIPYYVIFSRRTDRMRVFTLQSDRYVEQDLADSKIWMPEIELGIGLWQGKYKGVNRLWLRFYDANGDWILTDTEQADLRAEQAELDKKLAEQRAESLAQRLRELGIDL
ncbi:MAG: Uma2 family endonuclease [Pseudanabaena sp.]